MWENPSYDKSYDKIKEWTKTDNPEAADTGRNVFAHRLAVKAKWNGYSENEILNELLNDIDVNSLRQKEIETIVKSVYKK